jgi:hypothetical protein
MQVKEIVEGLGEIFLWTFEILPTLGNLPNIIFIGIGCIMFLYWMSQMVSHARSGEK